MGRPGKNPNDYLTRQELAGIQGQNNKNFQNMGHDLRLALFNLSTLIDLLQQKGVLTVEELRRAAEAVEPPAVIPSIPVPEVVNAGV
jgi:hypothetical protein